MTTNQNASGKQGQHYDAAEYAALAKEAQERNLAPWIVAALKRNAEESFYLQTIAEEV